MLFLSPPRKIDMWAATGGGLKTMLPMPLALPEFREAYIRKFFTLLFANRARSYIRMLGEKYGWTEGQMVSYMDEFITPCEHVPIFIEEPAQIIEE